MISILAHIFGVVILVGITTSSLFAQQFLGPRLVYTVSTSVGTDVSEFGAPTRFGIGLDYAAPLSPATELGAYAMYRIDNGGYLTPFVANGSVISNSTQTVNVVDPVWGAPKVTTTINTAAVEAGISLGIRVATLDSAGSAFLLRVGVFGDYIMSAKQVDDYSNVPAVDRGSIPVEQSYAFTSQAGFGATLGAAIVLPLGSGRMIFDVSYAARTPVALQYDAPLAGDPTEQSLAWLIGRGLRFGLGYQFGI